MTQQIFEDMIGTAPPSTVDIEAVIRRERRVIRWHRATMACAAGALAVALAGALALGNPGDNGDVGPADRGVLPSAATKPPPPLPKARVEALAREMREIVRRVAPSAKISGFEKNAPFGQYEILDFPTSVPSGELVRIADGKPDGIMDAEGYDASMVVKVGSREGSLSFSLVRFGSPAFECAGLYGSCSETTGPGGSTVLVNKAVRDGNDEAYTVNVTYPDGMRVWVLMTNARHADAVHYDRPPLTLEQVKQIALDPDLIPHP